MKVYTCFPGGKAKALTMSYDDGKVQDRRLIDIFNKYGIKGTFNLNYGLVGERPRMTFEEMKGLYAGHEIATHTMTHPTIERCPLVEVAQELLEDRKGLEKWTGQIVRGHAYPNGFLQRGDQAAVSSAGRGLCQSGRDGSGFCTAEGSVGVACYLPS